MTYYIENENGEWVEGPLVHGKKFKQDLGGGGSVIGIWCDPASEDAMKIWRDQELKATDWIVPIADHPQHSQYIAYRQALRDWPSTTDFPDTKPELGI
jgi:hypothetical protein